MRPSPRKLGCATVYCTDFVGISPNCPGAVRVWESAEMYPSFLTVPYDAE